MNLSIALIEPKYEVNVGHISRVMANFGFSSLLLVNPQVNLENATKFASHGNFVLKNAEICMFDDLKSFDYLIGTTAIYDVSTSNVLRSTVSPSFMAYSLKNFSGSVCLIFGRDTTGLRIEELEKLDMIVSIYAKLSYPTLNIGHAAAILLYELTKQRYSASEDLAPKDQRAILINYAIDLAKVSNFPEYKMPIFSRAFKQVIGKGRLTTRETTLLIGLFRKAIRAIRYT
jgi:TrmH family RNA methyltransferase